ncbi:type 1 glutamine amidotransferase domain-containing protein [Gracilibacillus sp. Marseille-QA3620]
MKKKVLAIVTSHGTMKKDTDKTGLWFSELVHFYDVVRVAGFPIDIVSINGGKVPIDPKSLLPVIMDQTSKTYHLDPYFISKLDHSLPLEEINGQDYDCVFFAGGHGTLWDFPESKKIQEITAAIYENGGLVTAVCHGPAALLRTRLSDGTHLLENVEVTGYSNIEEKLIFQGGKIPFYLEDELRSVAKSYKKSTIPFTSHVVEDKRIITGQNPQSARAVGEKTLKILQAHVYQ